MTIEITSGFVAWLIAIVAYVDLRRKGKHGFLRFLAFWGGLPVTLALAIVVPQGRAGVDDLEGAEGDDAALLEEVRRGRAVLDRGDGPPMDRPDAS